MTMQQAELQSLVKGLKADFKKPTQQNRKTIGDRANLANLAALEMLVETVAEKNAVSFSEKGDSLQNLAKELSELTGFIDDLGERYKKS
ncbi:MAG: hypothetical protein JKY12_01490 [Sneathiella sp.]|nr:hypothetical protein [Sneathiella sp.]